MNIYRYIIVLSFFALWLNIYLPSEGLYLLGLVLILSFGILHGANDIVIILKSFKSLKNITLGVVIVFYLTIVAVFALCFVILPSFALLCFVLLSAYHFGEQHWNRILLKSYNYENRIFYLVYGSLIFVLIFYFHLIEVEIIIREICGFYVNLSFLPFLIFGILALFSIFCVYYSKISLAFRRELVKQLFYLLILTIIFRVSDLIWAFAIYFVLWHSIPSLHDQIKFVYGDINKINIVKYLKQSFWYWLVSLIGLAIFFYLFRDTKVFEALLFSFVAAITFPHVLVIAKMFIKKSIR